VREDEHLMIFKY